jgi:putative FmdB family regulatory protein
MPIYEYICRDCGRPFEKMVRLSEMDKKPVCPTCGGADTQKQLSVFATRGSASMAGSAGSSSCSSSSGGGFR